MTMFHAIRRHLWLAALFAFASNLLMLAPTIYLLQVYDRVLPSRSLETLAMLMVVMGIALVMALAVDVVRSRLLGDLGRQLADQLDRLALAARIDAQARRSVRPDLATAQDVASLRAFLSGSGVNALLDMPWLVVYLGVMFLFHWSLGLIAIGSAVLLVALTLLNDWLTRNSVRAYTTRQRETDQLYAQISRNAEIVTVLGMNRALIDAWSARRSIDLDGQAKVADTSTLNRSIGKTVRQAIQIVMMGAGAWLVINQFATGGVMLATTLLLGKALAPIDQMLGSWKQFTEVRQAWNRLDALYRCPPAPRTVELPRPAGRLTVEALVFSSRSLGDPRARMLLRGVQFALAPGQLLVIVGPSASGKSTLLRLLAGLWQPQAGTVRLDGADIAQWPRDTLGRCLGYVPQDVELFVGTVAGNIARNPDPLGHDASAIVRAAQRAGVHDLVLSLPNGYETELGESGETLSGGQRQAIALARALYGDPSLVLLDEPNANLDADGERLLNRALLKLKQDGVTVVVVTHRQAVLSIADRVMVMRAGEVECFGTREQVQAVMQSRAKPVGTSPQVTRREATAS
ncbi:Alkaline protease secretion ATP-binding protein AprD [Paraburkholderia ribeironis]|uniref:Alkaline protease secretion ATP-binding protein AprD n=1 Tax=Paraburkholderia ribeironis TaxID=1247936 RepID=A0A1N7SMP1_9BURK|nr:type I secretion system permease/ATPase [Paraburkholderia ribeironis]SIT48640.1 Alkaline protease secretion ATP-binding protein AprD [Paraburkholderia ribeironis]